MTLFVSKIPIKWKEKDIKSLFEIYGTVDEISIPIDHRTRQGKGYAFVTMPDDNEAKDAIKSLHNTEYDERLIIVSESDPTQAKKRSTSIPANRSKSNNYISDSKKPIDWEKRNKKLPPWKRNEY